MRSSLLFFQSQTSPWSSLCLSFCFSHYHPQCHTKTRNEKSDATFRRDIIFGIISAIIQTIIEIISAVWIKIELGGAIIVIVFIPIDIQQQNNREVFCWQVHEVFVDIHILRILHAIHGSSSFGRVSFRMRDLEIRWKIENRLISTLICLGTRALLFSTIVFKCFRYWSWRSLHSTWKNINRELGLI